MDKIVLTTPKGKKKSAALGFDFVYLIGGPLVDLFTLNITRYIALMVVYTLASLPAIWSENKYAVLLLLVVHVGLSFTRKKMILREYLEQGYTVDSCPDRWRSEVDGIQSKINSAKASESRKSKDEKKVVASDVVSDRSTPTKGGSVASASKAASSSAAPQRNSSAPVKDYFMIRLGKISKDSSGDFLDNQSPGLGFAVGSLDGDLGLAFYHSELGTRRAKDVSELVDIIKAEFKCDSLSPEFVAGLIKSGMDRDADGLVDADPSLEKSFFEASETDDVSDHAPCMFAVCSVTTGLSGVMLDLGSGAVRCDNKPYNNLAEIYGSFDEDETWVLGAQAVEKEKQKGKTKPIFTRDFVRSIDWRAISEEAESQAMSDMRLTSYFEKVKNFTVIIDFSYRDDKNAGSKDLIKFLRVVISTDGEVADDDIVETVNDYVLDSYVMPAFQQHIESLGYDWSEFYEDWLDVFPGPPGAGFNVNFENDIVIKPWKE